ncbi:MAG: ECF transporter S component [Clostridiales bacterium]|jgi:riboflavin transporter FmnP|nr:ECF transporter S component [Clostridiales bacterium]
METNRVPAAQNKWRKPGLFTTQNIAMLAIFTAFSTVLYLFAKIPLPFFPPFLELQISDMPALVAGCVLGPTAGSVVVILRGFIKLAFTHTGGVGELADILIGLSFVLPAALIYQRRRSTAGLLAALLAGIVTTTAAALLCNWAFLIRFYSLMMPEGFSGVLGLVQTVLPQATESSFYFYYLLLAVLPFNLLRSAVCAAVTFVIYRAVGGLFERLIRERNKRGRKTPPSAEVTPPSVDAPASADE